LNEWFDSMFEDVAATGVTFTAIGIVTPDPASVESILSWAARLQDRVNYVVVENATTHQADFSYWRESEQAQQFRTVFQPVVLAMEFRLPELENPSRQHGVTLGRFELVPLDLLRLLQDKEVLLGAIDVASDRVETPEEVAETIERASRFVPLERLYPCTNCGMAPMDRSVAISKLVALSAGAAIVRRRVLAREDNQSMR